MDTSIQSAFVLIGFSTVIAAVVLVIVAFRAPAQLQVIADMITRIVDALLRGKER